MTAVAPILGSLFLLVAVIFLVYGLWQLALGRNMPGVLSWGYLPRNRPRVSSTWRRSRWRINGVVLIVAALLLGWRGLDLLHR
jgi:hypothetical protein